MNLLFSFFGRIGRGGFWLGFLLTLILSAVILGLIFGVMIPWNDPTLLLRGPDGEPLTNPDGSFQINMEHPAIIPAFVAGIVGYVLLLWTQFAVAVKRAHDRGKSGWWTLLMFIPLVGFFWWLVDLGILEGQQGPNEYGPDPRGAQAA